MSTITDFIRRLATPGRMAPETGSTGAVQASWNGTVLARSDRTVVVEGNHYFPPRDVDPERLEPSERTSICPWKGRAGYFDVVVEGERNPDAAWSYPAPRARAEAIKDHVAFWRGVEVGPAPE